VTTLLLLLLAQVPTFDAFDEPLSRDLWYIGVPKPPRKGVLRIPKDGWIVSRGIEDERVERIEVVFQHRGGELEFGFFRRKEPLSTMQGDPIVVAKGKGVRRLEVAGDGVFLDGVKLPWKGSLTGTFRLRAIKGGVDIDEVRVAPRIAGLPEPTYLERRTVLFRTTPHLYSEGEVTYTRVSLQLWDVDVCFLLRYGATEFRPLKAPPRGAPVLGALVGLSDGRALAMKAHTHALAMRDWGDERRNLSRGGFLKYLRGEYAVFEAMQHAQRALNAAVPDRKGLDALVHLAVIRHSANTRAAVALAETQKGKAALAALKKALGKGVELRRATPDQLRKAAGEAAKAILGGEPPAQWPGFRFHPGSRFVAVQQAKDLTR